MKKLTLGIGTAAAAIVPVAAVVACGGSDSKINPTGVLTVAVWKGNDAEILAKEKAFKGFKDANPDIKVRMIFYEGDKMQAIARWSAAGDMPDIILTDAGEISAFAESKTIVPIDETKFSTDDHKKLKGLVANVLAPAFGHMENGAFKTDAITGTTSTPIGQISIPTTAAASLPTNAHAYGLVKDFSTLAAYINTKAYKSGKTSADLTGVGLNDSLSNYINAAKNVLETTNLTNEKGGNKAVLGTTIDLARWMSLIKATTVDGTNNLYDKYKDATKSSLEANKNAFKADMLKLANQADAKAFYDAWVAGDAANPGDHKFGWNGEAFDKNALATTIEGNWFQPADKAHTDVIPVKGFRPICIYLRAYIQS